MANLELTLTEVRDEVSFFIGAGRDYDAATSVQKSDIDKAIRTGARWFYTAYGAEAPHTWSFLHKEATVACGVADTVISLPDDFTEIVGDVTYDQGSEKRTLGFVEGSAIRSLLAKKPLSGQPLYCALRSAFPSKTTRTRYELLLYPTPDAAYEMRVRYLFEPDEPSIAQPFLGGAVHAETIIEACLAVAEKRHDPESGRGVHWEIYQQELANSIARDMSIGRLEYTQDLWDSDDDQNGLSVTKSYIQKKVGQVLGIGPNPAIWNHGELVEVNECIRDGLRRFYNPDILPGEKNAHVWSFLLPKKKIGITADKDTYDLPSDFSYIEGPFTYVSDTSDFFPPVVQIPENEIRYRLSRAELTFRPQWFCIRPSQANEATGTKWEVSFYPKPQESYTLEYTYRIDPVMLSLDEAIPLGGQPHAQTLLAACMACADVKKNEGQPGANESYFMSRLIQSIKFDRQVSCPDTVGYSLDPSVRMNSSVDNIHEYDLSVITYNGVEWT